MGISKRNPKGNFNWQYRYLKRNPKGECCGVPEPDCNQAGPTLEFTGSIFCISFPAVSHTMTVTNTQPEQAATTFYEWYFDGVLVYSSYGPISSYTIPSATSANVGTYTIVATNEFGCKTTEEYFVYGAQELQFTGFVKQQPVNTYSPYDPGPYIDSGSVAISVLTSDPLAVDFVYRIVYPNCSLNPGTIVEVIDTDVNYTFQNLTNGAYIIEVEQRFNINGDIVNACNPLPQYMNLGPFMLQYADWVTDSPVADPNNLADWQSWFAFGNLFTSLSFDGVFASLYVDISSTTPITIYIPSPTNFGTSTNDTLLNLYDYGSVWTGQIYNNYFENCIELIEIKVNCVSLIQAYAFNNCVRLEKLEAYNLTSAGGFYAPTFYLTGQFALNPLTFYFPNLTSTGESCFAGSYAQVIDLPVLLVAQQSCFDSCKTVTFNLPLVQNVFQSAFFDCINIVSLYLPSCTGLGFSTLYNCINLQSLDLPVATFISGSSIFSQPNISINSLTYLNIPCVTGLGNSGAINGVFTGSGTGGPITINANVVLATNNGGLPDGDLQVLVAANPGTVVNYVTCP